MTINFSISRIMMLLLVIFLISPVFQDFVSSLIPGWHLSLGFEMKAVILLVVSVFLFVDFSEMKRDR